MSPGPSCVSHLGQAIDCFQSFQKILNRSGAMSVYRTVCMIFLAHVVLEGPSIMPIIGEVVAGSAFIGQDSRSLNMLHCTEVSQPMSQMGLGCSLIPGMGSSSP